MTADDFREHLSRLGYSNAGFGEVVGVEPRTVRRWASGAVAVPVAVQMLLEGKKLPRRVR